MPTTQTILSAAVEAQARRYMTAGLVPLSLNMETFVAKLYELCEEQQQRLDRRCPPIPTPLHLVAGAACLGVQIDLDTGWVVALTAPEGIGV